MKTLLWTARTLAFVGFLDAAYLTASHFSGGALACGPGGGCDIVTTSRFATVGPMPIAAIGLVYYAVVSLIAWTPSHGLTRGLAGAFLALTGTAVVISGVLVYLQATVIDAWCRFCLASAGITAGLFVTALALWRSVSRTPKDGSPAPSP